MMKMMMSAHVVEDRMERVMAIAQHIGWGVELVSVEDRQHPNRQLVITTTGVLLVRGIGNKLITAYVPNVEKLAAIYHLAGYGRVPTNMYARVKKNLQIMKRMGLV